MIFDLQMFAAKNPKKQIEEYILKQANWKEGDDPRLKLYSRKNVNKAIYYYEKNLRKGIIAPDDYKVNITETDFYKHITDPVFLRQPQLIREFILNSNIKIKQANGRYQYISFKPAGYVVVKEICYSVHYLGKGNKGEKMVLKELNRSFRKGGKIIWVQS